MNKMNCFGDDGGEINNRIINNSEVIASLRPIDDIMFECLMKNSAVCEEILRIILDDKELSVIEVVSQNSIKNLRGRSVRLDALCRLGDGRLCNVEVQRANNDDHQRRVRYNASVATANIVSPGEKFEQVPEMIVIYISEFDMFSFGRVIYHVERFITEEMKQVDNGLHEIYVTAGHSDSSVLGELMRCFTRTDLQKYQSAFPALASEFTNIKNDREEVSYMNKVLEEMYQQRDRQRDRQNKCEIARRLIAQGASTEMVINALQITEEELQQMLKEGE